MASFHTYWKILTFHVFLLTASCYMEEIPVGCFSSSSACWFMFIFLERAEWDSEKRKGIKKRVLLLLFFKEACSW